MRCGIFSSRFGARVATTTRPALAHRTRAQVHEQYVKLMMNPFYTYDTPITSESFDKKIHALARRHL